MWKRFPATVMALILLSAPAGVSAVPSKMQVQGVLETSSGAPATGSYLLDVRLFDAQTGGAKLYEQTGIPVTVAGGVFELELGPLADGLLADLSSVWLQVNVAGEPALPRRPLLSTAFALEAGHAATASVAQALDCDECVKAAQVAPATLTGAHIADGTVGADDVGFGYAASDAPGGAAKDVDCATGCISGSEIVSSPTVSGTLSVTGGIEACTGGATGCSVRLAATGGLTYPKDGGWMHIQTGDGVRIRSADNSAWRALHAGDGVLNGALQVAGNTGFGVAPDGAERVRVVGGSGSAFGLEGIALGRDVTGSYRVEVRNPGSGAPYIDLSNDLTSDYDARLRLVSDDALAIEGADLGVGTSAPTARLHVHASPSAAAYDPILRVSSSTSSLFTVSRNRATLVNESFDGGKAGSAVASAAFGVGANIYTTNTGVFRFEDQRTQPASNKTFVIESLSETSDPEGSLFEVAAAGLPRLVVQHGGRVGVGTATPAADLHVAGSAQIDGELFMGSHQAMGLRAENAVGAPVTCNTATAGYLYFDTGTSRFMGCDGKEFVVLNEKAMVTAKSCADALAAAPGSPSGTYTITPAVGSSYQVYCDMDPDEGGWTLVAQRNQYGSFSASWATTELGVGDLASYTPGIDLGTSRMSSLNVNLFMSQTGHDRIRVVKVHPTEGMSQMTFSWNLKQNPLTYNPSATRTFWYTLHYWCTGDGGNCKGHGGLGNGWDISDQESTNQWLTYYPGYFQHPTNTGAEVSYNQAGVAWIFLFAGKSTVVDAKKSCLDILNAGQSTGSGTYFIDPNGGDPSDGLDVYCDMTTSGGGWTLVAQRNQYGGFDAGWAVSEKGLSQLKSYQPTTNLGTPRVSSLNVNSFMAQVGASNLRVVKVHPSAGSAEMSFSWAQRENNLLYTGGGTHVFWYSGHYWCTGDGSVCKGHGGLGNGWDISASTGTNAWLTYYPSNFMLTGGQGGDVAYDSGGVAWIFFWAR